MQEIVDKYPINETEYLLPIITQRDVDYRKQYTNELHRVNHLLKKIGKQLDLSIPLTMYVGRHSWATVYIVLQYIDIMRFSSEIKSLFFYFSFA